MRLEITRKADLATRALLGLVATGERTKAAALADRVGTTPGFLSQAIAPLVVRGWVRSDPGPAGGYTARLDPAAVSVLDVIEAVEGAMDTERCVLEARPCSDQGHCVLHRPWTAARALLVAELGRTPLASLPHQPTTRPLDRRAARER